MKTEDSDQNPLIEERRDYISNTLNRQDLNAQPHDQFKEWLKDARSKKLIDATAMALSTVNDNGQPSSRIVLLKNIHEDGFTFYTNYNSDKGQQLASNNRAAVLFYWRELERQVRIEGRVSKIATDEADTYFNSRPEGSRLSAAASDQSSPVPNRQSLENEVKALKQKHPDNNVPRPEHWGGYILKPERFEFWQGRSDRLHDRFEYHLDDNAWNVQRLAP